MPALDLIDASHAADQERAARRHLRATGSDPGAVALWWALLAVRYAVVVFTNPVQELTMPALVRRLHRSAVTASPQ
jgi:hypothetical protein